MNIVKKSGSCCGSGKVCGCQSTIKPITSNQLIIDFLYLDLSVCTRCQNTDSTLDEALSEVEQVLKATGMQVVVNKIKIDSEETAIRHHFISSPTLRLNSQDIQLNLKENLCESCGDLCGEAVDCRIWVYKGVEYTAPPKAMIIEAILQRVYGPAVRPSKEAPYKVPDNLKKYFQAMNSKK